jgi:SAM-dependent methyltransferase
MTAGLERLVPRSVKRALKDPWLDVRARWRMRTLTRDLRRRYGPDLVLTVHPDDEMFHFMRDHWKWRFHVERMEGPADAMHTYLVSGDVMVRDLQTALRDQDRSLEAAGSVLEFAAGFGRFTRFLVTRVAPERITVSDISHDAVDFARSTFGVSGFYSTASPGDLDDPGRYEVIFVASLFSHLGIEVWVPWLRRLYGMLEPGGLLVFSTHGPYARDVIYGQHWTDRRVAVEDGFSFIATNETDGRLDEHYYGASFVTEEWVGGQVERHGLGTIREVYPASLWGSQDLYVVEKQGPA